MKIKLMLVFIMLVPTAVIWVNPVPPAELISISATPPAIEFVAHYVFDSIDISGYVFTKGITFTFPENTILEPNRDVYITYNISSDFWQNKDLHVFQWESGRLADEGETVRLETSQGIVIDQVLYNLDESWPQISNGEGITLKSNDLDNHFGKNCENGIPGENNGSFSALGAHYGERRHEKVHGP